MTATRVSLKPIENKILKVEGRLRELRRRAPSKKKKTIDRTMKQLDLMIKDLRGLCRLSHKKDNPPTRYNFTSD